MAKENIKALSLFACAGIGEYYLSRNQIKIVVANELLDDRCKFYRLNHPKTQMIQGDITKPLIYRKVIDQSKKEQVSLLIATPPCQGFSTAGKMDPHDERNSLILKVIQAIQDLSIEYCLIENVPNFFKHYIQIKNKPILVLDYLNKVLGNNYEIRAQVVNAADFGTPQNRKRAIVLMSKKGSKVWEFPELITPAHKTVRETISHLPSLESGEQSSIPFHFSPTHSERHTLWMKNTPTGKSAFDNPIFFPQKPNGDRIKGFKNTYKRIEWDKPAPTITMANGVLSSQENVHPGRLNEDGTYSDARVLSILELMLLSGLDLNWKIPSWAKDSLIRHVIGESVPPKLLFELTKFFDQK